VVARRERRQRWRMVGKGEAAEKGRIEHVKHARHPSDSDMEREAALLRFVIAQGTSQASRGRSS